MASLYIIVVFLGILWAFVCQLMIILWNFSWFLIEFGSSSWLGRCCFSMWVHEIVLGRDSFSRAELCLTLSKILVCARHGQAHSMQVCAEHDGHCFTGFLHSGSWVDLVGFFACSRLHAHGPLLSVCKEPTSCGLALWHLYVTQWHCVKKGSSLILLKLQNVHFICYPEPPWHQERHKNFSPMVNGRLPPCSKAAFCSVVVCIILSEVVFTPQDYFFVDL